MLIARNLSKLTIRITVGYFHREKGESVIRRVGVRESYIDSG